MTACERYARPLSREEKDCYLAEQAGVGRMDGADRVSESAAELEEYVEAMRLQLAMSEQTVEFVGFLAGRVDQPAPLPRSERWDRWVAIRASMGLMPEWARRMTGTGHPEPLQRAFFTPRDRLAARMIRWAYSEVPGKRRALARVAGTALAAEGARAA